MNKATQRALLVIAAVAALLLAACGQEDGDVTGDGVQAVNLDTGERKSFSSPGAVPPGWAPCADPSCSAPVPPAVPCSKLGAKVCELSPRCQLQKINCSGVACAQPGGVPGSGSGSGGASTPPAPPCPDPPPPPKCDLVCRPKPICSGITDAKRCAADPRCEWLQGPCPMMACAPGQPCPPCPYSCQKKATPPPPPPPPPPCPPIAQPGPEFCKNGRLVPKVDANKCIVGFTCEPKCPAIPMMYPQCPAGEKPQPRYNSDGCLVGWVCMPDPTAGCSTLQKRYAAALTKAKVCQLSQMGPMASCGVAVPSALACGCTTYVSSINQQALAELKSIKATWDAQGCAKNLACPAVACVPPKGASCKANISSGVGAFATCVDNR